MHNNRPVELKAPERRFGIMLLPLQYLSCSGFHLWDKKGSPGQAIAMASLALSRGGHTGRTTANLKEHACPG